MAYNLPLSDFGPALPGFGVKPHLNAIDFNTRFKKKNYTCPL